MHAAREDERTILRRVRYDGVMRCSRAFHHGAAAVIVTSQLGPGIVHGDGLTVDGTLDARAHLIVTAQAATRVLGGTRPARSDARWEVGPHATLELIGEPVVVSPGGRYESTLRIGLAGGARVLVSETVTAPLDSQVRLRTIVARDERECLYDALDAQCAAAGAIGTLALFGLEPDEVRRVTALLDGLCGADDALRIGVGAYPDGVLVRLLANSAWPVHERLAQLREALRDGITTESPPPPLRTVHLSNDLAVC